LDFIYKIPIASFLEPWFLPMQEIAQLAAEALVNLSSDWKLSQGLIAAGAVEKVMGFLGKPGYGCNKLLVMLLVNITQLESGAEHLLQVCSPPCTRSMV
jgi:hypothetical protein